MTGTAQLAASEPLETRTEQGRWWRNAVVYQVYVRSFADHNGDGTGDLDGVLDHLDYLASLGVDALWFSPWYPSPNADSGYDVSDYRAIDPAFGGLEQAREVIDRAAALGIRTIIDIVPNHLSDRHPWFREALLAPAGSPARQRFWFRDGRGPDGGQPPNDWQSIFGGAAWTRVDDPDGRPGQWYLHLFAAEQPDLNWADPSVSAEFDDVLRFWFDLGVAGIRIDSAALLAKDPALTDLPDDPSTLRAGQHPFTDRDELHEIYRAWRRLADSRPEPKALIGELWLPDAQRFAQYLRPDELHTAFNFDFLASPFEAAALRRSIDTTLAAHRPVEAPATWVLSNHDVTRPVTRFGRADTSFSFDTKRYGVPSDPALGRRRARAAALLVMALPGSMYLYQGEELGLPEVEDLPDEARQDPMHVRSGGTNPGRDGCRIPLPWNGFQPPYGFSPLGSAPTWLPQPGDWAPLTIAAQSGDPDSMLALYRTGLSLRRRQLRGSDEFAWADRLFYGAGPDLLAFARGPRFVCVLNTGPSPTPLPAPATILLASGPILAGTLPPDTCCWLQLP